MAKPVIVSPQALEGISAQAGRDLLLASDANEFVGLACDALDELPADLGRAARAQVEASYNWDVNMSRVDALLDIPSHQPRTASTCS